MQLHEAVELKEAYSVGSANSAIEEGWKLLAVAPGVSGITYVLGKPAKRASQLPEGGGFQQKVSPPTRYP